MNAKTGRLEIVFVHLEKVYPNRDNPMSEEYSFEELRAKHRGWLDYDWAAIRQKEQEDAQRAADAEALLRQPKRTSPPLAPKQTEEQPPKPRTVPLKGSIDDEVAANDENTPPSQEELDKAKAARRARREEKANRTRKIKVMDVKEVRGEPQTGEIATMQVGGAAANRTQSKQIWIHRASQKCAGRRVRAKLR